MNIAICLAGLQATWDENKDNITSNLIKGSDVFLISDGTKIPSSKHLILHTQKLYEDKLVYLHSKMRHPEEGLVGVKVILNMLYKIYKCNNLKKERELETGQKYDIVVRARPDVVYSKEIDLNIQEDTVYFPTKHNHTGLCDQFFYGSVMDYMCDLYLNILDYVDQGCPMHPETLVKYHFDKSNFKIERNNVEINIVRNCIKKSPEWQKNILND